MSLLEKIFYTFLAFLAFVLPKEIGKYIIVVFCILFFYRLYKLSKKGREV